MSDAIPSGLGREDALRWAIGAVAQNAAAVEWAMETLPTHTGDPEIDEAISSCRALEEQVRRERNRWVHGVLPIDIDSVRGTAQVLRRVAAQIAAIRDLTEGFGDRAATLRRARGRFLVDETGGIHDLSDD